MDVDPGPLPPLSEEVQKVRALLTKGDSDAVVALFGTNESFAAGKDDLEMGVKAATLDALTEERARHVLAALGAVVAALNAGAVAGAADDSADGAQTTFLRAVNNFFFVNVQDVVMLLPNDLVGRVAVPFLEQRMPEVKAALRTFILRRLKVLGEDPGGNAEKQKQKALERKRTVDVLPWAHLQMISTLRQVCDRLYSAKYASLVARTVLLLEHVLPIDNKGGGNVLKKKTEKFVRKEDVDEEDKHDLQGQANAAGKDDVDLTGSALVDYQFYAEFWALQQTLQQPDTLADSQWQGFAKLVKEVLTHLAPSDDERAPSLQALPSRYCTRSGLFRLQLKDPLIARQLCVQLAVTLDQMASKYEGRDKLDKLEEKKKAELAQLQEQCLQTFAALDGNRSRLEACCRQEAETWVAWKAQSCKEYTFWSQLGTLAPFDHDTVQTALAQHDRQALADGAKHGAVAGKAADTKWAKVLKEALDVLGDAGEQPKAEHKAKEHLVASLESYLTKIVQEEDPAQGIEEEYRRTNDKVFLWQARRLFCMHRMDLWMESEKEGTKTGVRKTGIPAFVENCYPALGLQRPKAPEPEKPEEKGDEKDAKEEEKPVGAKEKAEGAKAKPEVEKEAKPSEKEAKPDEKKAKPDEKKAKPDEKKAKPDEKKAKPEDKKAEKAAKEDKATEKAVKRKASDEAQVEKREKKAKTEEADKKERRKERK